MRLNYRSAFFVIFTLSGFSGLIYESIWSHYLKLFLGHAAYAQALVIAIFMGGMAIGSWISSRYSSKWKNLFRAYALAEAIIGFCALVFHPLFAGFVDIAYASILPSIGNPFFVEVFKFGTSASIIMPQCVLLGMTFPLMSAGIIRSIPERPGKSIALLYFTNSIGGAVGVLTGGFVLIEGVGMPWTMAIAGLINLSLAAIVWMLTKRMPARLPAWDKPVPATADNQPKTAVAHGRKSKAGKKKAPLPEKTRTAPQSVNPLPQVPQSLPPGTRRWYRFFLLASLITGLSSFIYEIGWIRMLSMVLGASTHAFELMLSAFILGLAFGGLWIQGRIDRIPSPVNYLSMVQIFMGLLALSTLLVYGYAFEVMQWIVKALPKTDNGYALFNLSSSAIAMGLMVPTTFFAGMTLPLITSILLQGHGEKSIGTVYAANTIGAIIGAFFAIHLGMPLLGLKGMITLGAALDIALGTALFLSAPDRSRHRRVLMGATVAGACAIPAVLLFVGLDPYKMMSGVYRFGTIFTPEECKILYHEDGKTATVSVTDVNGTVSIKTNGKPDGSLAMGETARPSEDEYTQTLLGVIALTFKPAAKTVGVIGLGSGMTSHTILCSPQVQQLDTIEIEKKMIEGANYFRPRVEKVFTDPRSTIYNDDAKTFFSTHKKNYDVIVSEPSNPWVSGVAGLFSTEFYHLLKNHIKDDGLLVQWVHLYALNFDLVVSVLKAIREEFSDFALYLADDQDLLIVAIKAGTLPEPEYGILRLPDLVDALRRIYVMGEQDIMIRRIGSKKLFNRFLDTYPIRANSDYYPVLERQAVRSSFLHDSAMILGRFPRYPLPALEMLDGAARPKQHAEDASSPMLWSRRWSAVAMCMRDYFLSVDSTGLRGLPVPDELKSRMSRLKDALTGRAVVAEPERLTAALSMAIGMPSFLSPSELEPIWMMVDGEAFSKQLSNREKLVYELIRAVGNRDAAGMRRKARLAVSEGGSGYGIVGTKYILASGMLGCVAEGDKSEFDWFWSRYKSIRGGLQELDLLCRLLAAQAGAE